MRHVLKIAPEFLDAILDDSKTFELRRNDRHYQKGDTLVFDIDWPTAPVDDPSHNIIECEVGYVLSEWWGLEPGYVVLSIRNWFIAKGAAARGEGAIGNADRVQTAAQATGISDSPQPAETLGGEQ